MPRATVGVNGGQFGTAASNGATVVFTQHKNPDGSAVKDTRT